MKPLSWYKKRSKEIVRKNGYSALMKKANFYIQTFLDMKLMRSRSHISGFHKVLYYSLFLRTDEKNVRWLGVPAVKSPLDSWIYQEILWDTKPEFIIETGTDRGGSALFFASICDLLKKGKVITIDIVGKSDVSHSRIKKIIGDSVSPQVVNQVKRIVGNKTAMVVLDSNHTKDHVLKEIEAYGSFVTLGNYMVVEDTNINSHPVLPGWGKGPMEAVNEFLKTNSDFVPDRSREKFLVTFHPKGFLKRIKQTS